LYGAITASHPIGIGTHCSAVDAVNPIPVHSSTAAAASTPVTTHSVTV
jgi:hypothetical protein